MKTINYTGNSKLITRIVNLLNRKAPLPLDGQGDAEWGTSGQVLTTDGQGNTYWGDGGDVTDVEVNGTSVVNAQGVAEVSVPTNTSDLNNDSGFITSADVPSKTSDLTNDSGFITSLVNNLANYYTKSQTYTQAEVDALISGIVTLNILVVQTLPTQDISTTTIYLVPKQDAETSDIYDEYLYINNAWELIGTTQIDLSNYVTTTDLSTALADYVTSVGLATILTGYAQLSDLGNGTLTIQQNGTTLGTFSANQNGNTTVNLTGGGSTYTEGDGIDITNDEISVDTTFTEASARANIASGDSLATIWGKIKKFFTDIKTVAFTGSYDDLSDQPTIPSLDDVKTLKNYYDSRPASADVQFGDGRLRQFKATGSMTTGKPATDGNITHFAWDNTGGWDAQLFVPNSPSGQMQYRTQNSGTWQAWKTLIDSGNIGSQSVASATKATQDGSGNTITSTYVPLKTYAGVGSQGGNGSYSWCRLATLTITGKYANGAIAFEVSQRGTGVSLIQVGFVNENNKDPALEFFTTNNSNLYYIKKVATSKWELYCSYNDGTWGSVSIHRIFGYRYGNGVSVSVDLANISAPTGTTQVTYGGNVAYATSAGSVTNYGNRSLTVVDGGVSTLVGFLGTASQSINLDTRIKKAGDYMTGNLYIGDSGAGGYLNGSAANGGCNSIFIGDDVWLGDVNAGGILGMKSTGASCGLRFLNSSGTTIGNLYSDGSVVNVDRSFRLSDTNQVQFGNDSVFINRDSSWWLNLKAGNGIVYRGQWHDFKNPAASAWVSISAGGFVTQSSKRYKENIEDITDEDARKLLNVRTVSFDYKDGVRDEDRNKYNQHGVIAEEVDEIFPEVVTYAPLVREDPESELVPDGVDYAKFVPYLIKMVQIQQKEIDELKAIVRATITETATE